MNIEKAKQIPIELVLQKMNYTPSKTNGFDVWFLSPFRVEKTPSFKVNTKINRWYDHGLQKGGNIIDFVSMKFNYTISEVLNFLNNYSDEAIFSFQKQKSMESNTNETISEIKITKVIEIQHYALKQYLESRNVNIYEDEPNLKELHYTLKGKNYFAIAFQNNSLGFELRSKYTKICIGKKDITLIKNNSNTLLVFEGFMDYLSYKNSSHYNTENLDFLILNSVAMINKCVEILLNYEEIDLYLDNDNPGKTYTQETLKKYNNCIDKSNIYSKYKDFNEYHINTQNR